jgi:glycosyltransferase involved in cell wall biosynthesis
MCQRADVLHLHWLGEDTASIEELGAVRKPIVWTLHDQWPFCGEEHYTSPPLPGESASNDERFVLGYSSASRPAHESGRDLNRYTWLRKRRACSQPMHIVCPSTWMSDCVRRSALMRDWPISVIPYPIDLETWAPVDMRQARTLLNLSLEPPLVLFGAMGGTHDTRKGANLLFRALQLLSQQVSGSDLADLQLVVFGQSRPSEPPQLGFPIHFTGRLYDDLCLRLL